MRKFIVLCGCFAERYMRFSQQRPHVSCHGLRSYDLRRRSSGDKCVGPTLVLIVIIDIDIYIYINNGEARIWCEGHKAT